MWGIDIVPSWAARYRIRRNMLFSCSGAEKWRGQGEMPQHKTSRRCLCQPACCVPRDCCCCCCCYTFCKGLGALGEPYCKKKNKPTPVCFKTPGFISNWIRGSQTLILAGGSIDYVSLPLQTSLSPFCISSSALALLSRVTATASSTGRPLPAAPQRWDTSLDTADQESDETADTMESVDAPDIKSTRGKSFLFWQHHPWNKDQSQPKSKGKSALSTLMALSSSHTCSWLLPISAGYLPSLTPVWAWQNLILLVLAKREAWLFDD